ncbi:hypothetical protein FRX31_019498, partial [Thalictrum thalictroides]
MTQQHHPHNLNMNIVEPIPQLGIDLTSTGYEQAQEAQLEQQHVVVSLLNQSLNQSPNVISNTSAPSVSPPPLQAHDEVFDEIRLKNSSIEYVNLAAEEEIIVTIDPSGGYETRQTTNVNQNESNYQHCNLLSPSSGAAHSE